MAKNTKRRRNGKLKIKNVQIIKLNIEKSATEKKSEARVIFLQPTVGCPKRSEFGLTSEGKAAFKEAKCVYYKSTPKIKKTIISTVRIVKYSVKKELTDMFTDSTRLSEIKRRFDAYLDVCKSKSKTAPKPKKVLPVEKEIISTIRLSKSKNVIRIIDHDLSPNKKIAIVLKLRQKQGK